MSLTGACFLLAFAIGMGLALFRHPRFGLYTYLAVFYIHPPSRWWGEGLPDLRWALLAAVVTLVASWRLPSDRLRPAWLTTTPARALLIFTAWFWIQNLWAFETADHLEASFLFTKYVVLFYLVYRLVETPEEMFRFLFVHVAGCAYLGLLAFSADVSGRLEGVGGPGIDEANAFAMHMGTGLVAAAMLALSRTGIQRWFSLLVLPFILNGIILSGSRGGFLALVCGGIALWYLKPWAHRRLFYVFAALGCVALAALAHDMFWERLGTMEAAVAPGEVEMDTSAQSRFAIVEAQLQMAKSYPQGTGHRGTATLSPLYLDERFMSRNPDGTLGRRASHNTFMTALVEQGIPGAIYYAWIWIWTALAVLRLKGPTGPKQDANHRTLLASVAAGLVLVLVAGVFVDYIKTEVQFWLWALLASMQNFPSAQRSTVASKSSIVESQRPSRSQEA